MRASRTTPASDQDEGPIAGSGPDAPPLLELRRVEKTFVRGDKKVHALRDFSLTVQQGDFVSVIGPSGCGKSTLLNLIAGLMPATGGTMRFRGKGIPRPNTAVGYVTQKDNLMPWRSVADNIGVPLEIGKVPKSERHARVQEAIELVGLTGFEDSYPSALSGGMRKRTSLARTLVYSPEVILFDEPFAALDAQLKRVMHAELLRIWQSGQKRTIIFITHDVSEAILLADRVIVCSQRPATIKADHAVNLPRPRDVDTTEFAPEFVRLNQELWAELGVHHVD